MSTIIFVQDVNKNDRFMVWIDIPYGSVSDVIWVDEKNNIPCDIFIKNDHQIDTIVITVQDCIELT